MSTVISPTDIEAGAHALIQARRTSLGIEVSMPVVYPNGQMVTVVVNVDGGEYVVHDAGFGSMYLTSAGARLTGDLNRRLADMAKHYGCEFVSGRMSRRANMDQLALAMVMVANASRTVGDQIVQMHRHSEGEFRQAVTNQLRDIVGPRFRLNEEFKGASGRKYRIPNVILDAQEMHPVAFVVALPNRALVSDRFAEFFDLKQAHTQVANDAVYDDSATFRQEDWNLLRQVSEPIPYRQMRERIALVAA